MSLKLTENQTFLAVFCISLFLCLIGSGSYPIYILDEAKNAETAREILMSGRYFFPTYNGTLFIDKPPVHYYAMILGYKIFGINALGARFFSGIFGAFTFLISFYYVKKFATDLIAKIYILIMWSAVFFIQEFHLAVPDPYLIFATTTALWLSYDFYITKSKKSLYLMYACLGFGMLTKGPIGIALPGLCILLFIITQKQFSFKTILSFKPILGILLMAIISAPWYVLVHMETDGAWTQGFFLDHNVNRFGAPMEGHGGIFLVTWAFVLLGLMPFSFFILYAINYAYKHKKDSLIQFTSVISIVVIGLFSISGTKLPNYTMPCYPFLVFIIAKCLHDFYKAKKKSKHITVSVIIISIIALALPFAGKFALSIEASLKGVSNTAFWLLPTSIITLLGAYFYFKSEIKKSFLTIISGWIMLVPILFAVVYPKLTSQSPVETARPFLKDDVPVIVYKRFDAAFPINYQRTYKIVSSEEEVVSFFDKNPNGVVLTRHRGDIGFLNNNYTKILECKALFESHTTRIFKKN